MATSLKLILKSGKDDALRRYHPWVFSGAIKKTEGVARDGAIAHVYSNKNEYLGCGIYQDATIAVRILAFAPEKHESFTASFWSGRLQRAWNLRQAAGLTSHPLTNVYRLVHGEGDHLPGLIIDHYDGHLVIQIHATGLYGYLPDIAKALETLYGSNLKSIYDKSRDTLPADFVKEQGVGGFLHSESGRVQVKEYGHIFEVDIAEGQKTGFFIDQRENRYLLGQYSQGRRVLNTFCYSGGFSVYALKAGAACVHSLDSSARAMDLTDRNVFLNDPGNTSHLSITSDAMQYLRETEQEYDLIILDPPAYAKHAHVRHNAVQGYKRLNLEPLRLIRPGGLLFSFSCSQVVDLPLFRSTLMSAGILAGRRLRILHQLSQPADHPVNMFHPEGQYLKGLVLHVD